MTALETARVAFADGQLSTCIHALRQASIEEPDNPETYYRMGLALIAMRDYAGALPMLRASVDFAPDSPYAWYNLGICEEVTGHYGSALKAYARASALDETNCLPLLQAASVYYRQGQSYVGEDLHDKALAIQTDDPDQLAQRSFAKLLRGDYPGGFQDYEHRWHSPVVKASSWLPDAELPRWTGDTRERLLIVAEQGLGDAIQMARYHDLFTVLGMQVVWMLPESLWPVLPRNMVLCRPKEIPEDAEAYLPLMSLPGAVGAPGSAAGIPVRGPYLTAPQRTDTKRLAVNKRRPLIGVCTHGNKDHMNDGDRSMPAHLRDFYLQGTYADVAHSFDWLSLDQDACVWDLTDFGVTADLIMACDAILTVDTSVMHLAGALGKPTYLIPPSAPEWRHGMPAPGSNTPHPWYTSVTSVWRTHTRDWAPAIRRALGMIQGTQ